MVKTLRADELSQMQNTEPCKIICSIFYETIVYLLTPLNGEFYYERAIK